MRPPSFSHPADTLAFRNETRWSYALDPRTQRQVHQRREPPPDYTLRCFVMARVVKLFHAHAWFDPAASAVDETGLRNRLRRLLRRNPRSVSPEGERIPFPGFANLNDFSVAHEPLLKAGAGGAWHSYFQRGHWRMVLPFTRQGQQHEARRLLKSVQDNRAPVLHFFTFPGLTVNHAVVVFSAVESSGRILFGAYDPNEPQSVLTISFEPSSRRFVLPPTPYFVGGPVNAYEVYCRPWR